MSSTGNAANSLLDTLERRIPRQAEHIAVAFSGGADSAALLALAAELRRRRPLRLSAVYVDHALRPRSERERELRTVLAAAEMLAVPLTGVFLPPGRISADGKEGGTEAAARRARYRALHAAVGALGAEYLCTAHTREDQVETVLMRVFQGAGPAGLSGIREEEGLLRPLLNVPRNELRDYLRQRGIPWSEDSTNRSERYLRNALRRRLLPVVEELFPGYREGVMTLAEKAGKVQEALERWQRLPEVRTFSRRAETDLPAFAELPAWGREEVIYRLFHAALGGREYRLPYRFVRNAAERAAAGAEGIVARGHGIVLQNGEQALQCLRNVVSSAKNGYLVRVQTGRYRLWDRMECSIELLPPQEEAEDPPYRRELEPYLLSSPREGDRPAFPGGREKPLKELLYELGVPAEERALVPVLRCRVGIAAVYAGPWGGPVLRTDAGEEQHRPDGRIRVTFHVTGEST